MADQSQYRITAELNGVEVPVIRLHLQEALSEPFIAHLDVYDTGFNHKPLGIENKLDAYAVITLWDGDKPVRYVNGIVHAIEAGAVGTRRRYFTLTIVPEIYSLKLTHDCRIFQNLDVEGIVRLLLREHRVLFLDFALKKRRENRAYCVQFEESVFDFIHRLLAEEGIWYYFEHTADYHKLMFRDGVERAEAIGPLGYQDRSANKTGPCIWEVGYAEQRVPTRTTQRDRTFKNPNYTLEHTYHGLYIENQRKDAYKTYRYHGRYKRDEQGKPFTQYFQQQLQNRQRVATFKHDYLHVKEGQRFRLQNHPEDTRNQLWVTVRNTLEVEQPQASHEEAQANFNSGVPIPAQYASRFELETEATPYPQQFSPPAWPKPVVHGVHIADVVGPPNEEIFCDDYGRVAVQFPWDRYAKGDHTSSCWIRVAQNWAGAAWGHIAIPRIGHEVLVSYDNGDIDQPIITGRSYNANNLPPYKLAQHKTRMVIKSKSHKSQGHNELYFDDKTNNEEIYIHAQKDQNNIVLNDETTRVDHDRTEQVGNDETLSVGHDQTNTIGNDQSYDIGRNRISQIGKDQVTHIGNSRKLEVYADQVIDTGGHYSHQVNGKLVIKSGEKIQHLTTLHDMGASSSTNTGRMVSAT